MASVLFVAVVAGAAAAQRTITVRNLCNTTLWPAIYTKSGPPPNPGTGWEAAPGTAHSFKAQPGWVGSVWARTGCNFTGAASSSQCAAGACADDILCSQANFDRMTAPATLAELSIASAGPDFYDVSIVDGFNLPVTVSSASTDSDCAPAACMRDLLPGCPPQLATEEAGTIVACPSACWKGLIGDQANSSDCCTGSFDTPTTCPTSNVQFYDYFHTGCPGSYAYPFDDGSGLHSCAGSASGPDYEIIFCPKSDAVIPSGTSSASTSQTSSTSPTSQTQATGTVTEPVPRGPHGKKKNSTAAIVGETVGAGGLLVIAAGVVLWLRRRKRRANDADPVPYPRMVGAGSPPRSSGLFSKIPRQSRSNKSTRGSRSSAIDNRPPPAYSTVTAR